MQTVKHVFHDMLTIVDNSIRYPVKAYVAQRSINEKAISYGPPELPKAGLTNNRRLVLWGTCYGCKQKQKQSQDLSIVQITLPVLKHVVHYDKTQHANFRNNPLFRATEQATA